MISMWKVREMVDKATNLVMNYTETEAKVLGIFFGCSTCQIFVSHATFSSGFFLNVDEKVTYVKNLPKLYFFCQVVAF